MLELYKNIRTLRKQNNWSQEELAKRMGYTDRSTIAKIESGRVDLPQSKILEFAKVFGIDAGDLMGNDGIVSKPMDTEKAKRIVEAYANLPTEVLENTESISEAMDIINRYENLPQEKKIAFQNYLKFLQSDA